MKPILAPRRCFPFHSVCGWGLEPVKLQVSPLSTRHPSNITVLTTRMIPAVVGTHILHPLHIHLESEF